MRTARHALLLLLCHGYPRADLLAVNASGHGHSEALSLSASMNKRRASGHRDPSTGPYLLRSHADGQILNGFFRAFITGRQHFEKDHGHWLPAELERSMKWAETAHRTRARFDGYRPPFRGDFSAPHRLRRCRPQLARPDRVGTTAHKREIIPNDTAME